MELFEQLCGVNLYYNGIYVRRGPTVLTNAAMGFQSLNCVYIVGFGILKSEPWSELANCVYFVSYRLLEADLRIFCLKVFMLECGNSTSIQTF